MEKHYYKEYYHLERNHWWFKARLEILEAILRKQILNLQHTSDILNAGVATGATTTMLEKHANVTSLEYEAKCCQFLREQLKIEVTEGSLTELPYADQKFDLICAFDVIEHIEDHELAMKEANRVLKPGGKCFITVPAYMFLWSEHDVVNHHFRRYKIRELENLVEQAGFKVEFKSYFNALLFPPIAAARIPSRWFKNTKDKSEEAKNRSDFEKFKSEGFINKFFYSIFKSEKNYLAKKRRFPFGVSIVLIGSKT